MDGILDPAFSVINWFLIHLHIANPGPSWLGDPRLAMGSLIVVNFRRGLPFYTITLLAGLETISAELLRSRNHRRASAWTRFRYVTLSLLKPVTFIVTMFSVIFTFADFQLVCVLTRGGTANATHLFATYAFDVAVGGGQLGMGASIAPAMVPPLTLIIAAMAIHMKPAKS